MSRVLGQLCYRVRAHIGYVHACEVGQDLTLCHDGRQKWPDRLVFVLPPAGLTVLFCPALRHVNALLDSRSSTASPSSRCVCVKLQNRCSAILTSIAITLLGLKAAWYLCKMTNSVTYMALLVKCRSYKDATKHNPLAQWQVFSTFKRQLMVNPLKGNHVLENAVDQSWGLKTPARVPKCNCRWYRTVKRELKSPVTTTNLPGNLASEAS